MSDEIKIAEVAGKKVQWDPAQMRKIQEHPCFSEKACHAFGRCHIPVAPKCNIQCNYCIRDFDCVNESRPGVTTRILKPDEAMDMVKKVVDKYDYIKVIGIAGPGDPLANEETFETLKRLHEQYPGVIKCISTNGLLLPEKIDLLQKYDVGNITVTLNAIDPEIGAKIYQFVDYHGKRYTGIEAAKAAPLAATEGYRDGSGTAYDREDQYSLYPGHQRRSYHRHRKEGRGDGRLYL